ncbi:hypothetical protein IGI04_032189 [Brassica rapa subsp. trilocularis]|uniref:RNase H type-1 domain-containing protein n=1 Tax=Brassica rapa subsp. trilocularis TaxID=1813537 RepID=A0ABQ7LVR3_BRACM|nr:hypothetical protein IGI04_032189 [Brassica rapa subsp. trilocularis]
MELRRICCESDSSLLIKALHTNVMSMEIYGIVADINELILAFDSVSFRWISREKNMEADMLTKNCLADEQVLPQKKLKALRIHNLLSSKAYAAMASSLSYPSLPLRLTLPSTSSPATIAISLDKSEKLLVRRQRIVGSKRSMGFLVKISDINKLYQPENLLLYLNTMRDYKFGSDKVIIDGLQIFKMCPSLARDHVYMEAIVCVEDKQMSEFFFHLMRNQRLPSSKVETAPVPDESRISTTVLLGPVFLGNKGLNDVENDELPRLVYVLVRREPN